MREFSEFTHYMLELIRKQKSVIGVLKGFNSILKIEEDDGLEFYIMLDKSVIINVSYETFLDNGYIEIVTPGVRDEYVNLRKALLESIMKEHKNIENDAREFFKKVFHSEIKLHIKT